MNIIPAIDILNGRCAFLTEGDFEKASLYPDDPLYMAHRIEDAGFTRLHLVDLDGARARQMVHLPILEQITRQTKLKVDFGGGVHQIDDVQRVLDAGASMVAISSMAITQPLELEEWLLEFGPDRFFIGADVQGENLTFNGWQEQTHQDVFQFIGKIISLGATHVFCTDVERDGYMKGPSVDLYKRIINQHPEIELVANGGVADFENLNALKEAGCAGAIIGKALFEGRFTLEKLAQYN